MKSKISRSNRFFPKKLGLLLGFRFENRRLVGAACEDGKAAASANDNNVISHNKGAACEGKPASGADDSDNKGIKCEGKPASADDDSDISDNEAAKVLFPRRSCSRLEGQFRLICRSTPRQ